MRAARERAGLSPAELGTRAKLNGTGAGIGFGWVQRVEDGRAKKLSRDVYTALVAALGIVAPAPATEAEPMGNCQAPNPAGFGGRVREARKARGLTQDQLGGLVGIKKPWLSQIETGRAKSVKPDLRAKFISALPELAEATT